MLVFKCEVLLMVSHDGNKYFAGQCLVQTVKRSQNRSGPLGRIHDPLLESPVFDDAKQP